MAQRASHRRQETFSCAGVQVTLIDANHCPGAVQLLFELPDGSKYIHCGDMRYCRQMQDNPHLARFRGANAVFLDTTWVLGAAASQQLCYVW